MAEERPTDGEFEPLHRMGRTERWVAGVFVGIALLAGFALLLGRGPTQFEKNASETPLTSALLAEEALVLCPDPPQPAARAAFEAFTEALDLSSKAKWVRDSARVLPMMTDYHQRRGHPFPNLSRISEGKVAKHHANPMVFFQVEPYPGKPYPVAMIWNGHRFEVDWESLTAYGTLDWSDFLIHQPTVTHTFRTYLQAVSVSQNIPGTPAGWVAFRIDHRDNPQPVIALANRSVAAALTPLVVKQRVPVTLELRWRAVIANRPAVPEIVKLVSQGWSP